MSVFLYTTSYHHLNIKISVRIESIGVRKVLILLICIKQISKLGGFLQITPTKPVSIALNYYILSKYWYSNAFTSTSLLSRFSTSRYLCCFYKCHIFIYFIFARKPSLFTSLLHFPSSTSFLSYTRLWAPQSSTLDYIEAFKACTSGTFSRCRNRLEIVFVCFCK